MGGDFPSLSGAARVTARARSAGVMAGPSGLPPSSPTRRPASTPDPAGGRPSRLLGEGPDDLGRLPQVVVLGQAGHGQGRRVVPDEQVPAGPQDDHGGPTGGGPLL